jgi:histidinol phosphatase-like enzyme
MEYTTPRKKKDTELTMLEAKLARLKIELARMEKVRDRDLDIDASIAYHLEQLCILKKQKKLAVREAKILLVHYKK